MLESLLEEEEEEEHFEEEEGEDAKARQRRRKKWRQRRRRKKQLAPFEMMVRNGSRQTETGLASRQKRRRDASAFTKGNFRLDVSPQMDAAAARASGTVSLPEMRRRPPRSPYRPSTPPAVLPRLEFDVPMFLESGLTMRLKSLQAERQMTSGFRAVKGLPKPGLEAQLPVLHQALADLCWSPRARQKDLPKWSAEWQLQSWARTDGFNAGFNAGGGGGGGESGGRERVRARAKQLGYRPLPSLAEVSDPSKREPDPDTDDPDAMARTARQASRMYREKPWNVAATETLVPVFLKHGHVGKKLPKSKPAKPASHAVDKPVRPLPGGAGPVAPLPDFLKLKAPKRRTARDSGLARPDTPPSPWKPAESWGPAV